MTCKHNDTLAAELVMRCFNARTQAHVLHLSAKGEGSYAKHVALGAFYEEIGELADSFAEAYQGMCGELLALPAMSIKAQGPIPMLDTLEEWIESNRGEVCDMSNIQNEIDAIVTLIQSTRYKLKFLK